MQCRNLSWDDRWLVGAGFLVLTLAAGARADTLLVPSEYATIQAAIDAASDGDEVVIADGTYTGDGNRDLSFLGKAITVRSASGDPELCIIDCEEAARGFTFNSGESLDSVLSGLTILRGLHFDDTIVRDDCPAIGGGIFVEESSATISNCAFVDCFAFEFQCDVNFGGAIAVENGAAVIDACRFVECRVSAQCFAYGGAISIRESQVEITASLFEDNVAGSASCAGQDTARGGAVYCRGLGKESNVAIRNSRFLSNGAGGNYGRGGAIFVDQGATVDLVNRNL